MRLKILEIGFLLIHHPNYALAINWTGNADGVSWEDTQNWSGLALPGIRDDVTISSDSVSISSAVIVKTLVLTNATLVLTSNPALALEIALSSNTTKLELTNSKCILDNQLTIRNHHDAIAISAGNELNVNSGGGLKLYNIIDLLISNYGLVKVESGTTLDLKTSGENVIYNQDTFTNSSKVLNDGQGCTRTLRMTREKLSTCSSPNLFNSYENTFTGNFDKDWHKNHLSLCQI